MSGFFITGTDTGVGKTFVTGVLMHALLKQGLSVAPMKPVAAGTIDTDGIALNEDVALLMALAGHPFPLHAVNPYCFRDAIAPHIAATREGVEADIGVIQTAYLELRTRADVVLVEGAGGFLVPLSNSESMALIPQALLLPVILVVGMRLGCINHALLTAEAIQARGLRLAGWIANQVDPAMLRFQENLDALRLRMEAPLLGVVPFQPGGEAASAAASVSLPA